MRARLRDVIRRISKIKRPVNCYAIEVDEITGEMWHIWEDRRESARVTPEMIDEWESNGAYIRYVIIDGRLLPETGEGAHESQA